MDNENDKHMQGGDSEEEQQAAAEEKACETLLIASTDEEIQEDDEDKEESAVITVENRGHVGNSDIASPLKSLHRPVASNFFIMDYDKNEHIVSPQTTKERGHLKRGNKSEL